MYLWFLSFSCHIQLAAYLVNFFSYIWLHSHCPTAVTWIHIIMSCLDYCCGLSTVLFPWPLVALISGVTLTLTSWNHLKKKKLDTTLSCFKFPIACCCSRKRFKFFVKVARFVPNWPHLVLQPQLFPVFTYILDGQATQDCPLLLKPGTMFHDSALLPYYPLCLGCSYFLSIFQVQFPMPIPFQISSSFSS